MLRTTIAALTLLAAGAGVARADVKVALVGPMTGQFATFFEQMKRGAEDAATAINKAGGIDGQKIVLDLEDDACDPKQAVAAANKIVSNGDVAVIGHFCSSSSIPASDIYADASIPMISPGSTNPALTERGLPDIFRTCGRDDKQSAIAASAILKIDPKAKVAVIDDRTTYGKGLADGVRSALAAKGGTSVVSDSVTQGTKDFSTLISKLKAANINFVFYGGYYPEAGLFVRQAREQGFDARFMSGDGIAAVDFGNVAGPASNGVLMTFSPDERSNPQAAAVVKTFREERYEPEGYTLYTYAALQAYAEAARDAKSTDGTKVADALHKDEFKTVIGKIRFDAKGDPNAEPYIVYVWQNGKYEPLT